MSESISMRREVSEDGKAIVCSVDSSLTWSVDTINGAMLSPEATEILRDILQRETDAMELSPSDGDPQTHVLTVMAGRMGYDPVPGQETDTDGGEVY